MNKIIHYCWFGGNPIPDEHRRCIESWKKYCPDYEIKEWNENNFDIHCCEYVEQAYQKKKWAFVSDYARFWILFHFGGLYFDTDVEIIKPLDMIISKGPFMGIESHEKDTYTSEVDLYVNPGLGLYAKPRMELYKEVLDFYNNVKFINSDGTLNETTIVVNTTNILIKYGLEKIQGIQCIEGINIYPQDYFNPKSFENGIITITENTHTIHHFSMSWISDCEKKWRKRRQWLIRTFEDNLGNKLYEIVVFPHRVMNKIKRLGIKQTYKFILSRMGIINGRKRKVYKKKYNI